MENLINNGDNEVLETTARITPQWLAGFFDGEGSVCASKAGPMYNVSVSITQCDLKILTLIALRFKEGVQGPYLKRTGLGSKKCYRLHWAGRNAIQFLECIKDHVIIKREQVEAALGIAKLVSKREGHGADRSYASTELAERAGLALVIKNANHRRI